MYEETKFYYLLLRCYIALEFKKLRVLCLPKSLTYSS